MNLYRSEHYLSEITSLGKIVDLTYLNNQTIALTGATGMIGSYLIDTLLMSAAYHGTMIALVRDVPAARMRFDRFINDKRLIIRDVNLMEPIKCEQKLDYVIHAASMTSPHDYAAHPIDTLKTNLIGNMHMLDLACDHHARYMFISSTEVYGQASSSLIDEKYSGYLDPLDVRSAYNEGKRASETMCSAYMSERQLDIVIPRLSRVYGPTLKDSDKKALSQFIKAGVNHTPIVLKSDGRQMFSYMYVADAVTAILFLLRHGKSGEAYNVAHPEQKSLKDIATLIATMTKTTVTYDLTLEPGMSYSKAQYALFNLDKITSLGWQAKTDLTTGLTRIFAVNADLFDDHR